MPDIPSEKFWITFAPNHNEYSFSVMACNGIRLLISRGGQGSATMFALLIERDELFLYSGTTLLSKTVAVNVLSCLEYRSFMLRWQNGVLEVLQSGNGGRTLLSLVESGNYSMDSIHGLEIMSTAHTSDWMVSRIGGICSIMKISYLVLF